jgi:hypothetical protein
MFRKKLLLGLSLVILVASAAVAQDLKVTGFYRVTRMYNQEAKRDLQDLTKKHVSLIQAGKNAAAKKLMDKKITPLKKKLKTIKPQKAGYLDFEVTESNSRDEEIRVSCWYSESLAKPGYRTAHGAHLPVDLYYSLFETDKKVNVKNVSRQIKKAWAKGKRSNRRVYIEKKYDEWITVSEGKTEEANVRSFMDIRIIKGKVAQLEAYYYAKSMTSNHKQSYKAIIKLTKEKDGANLDFDDSSIPDVRVKDYREVKMAARDRTARNFKSIGNIRDVKTW